ncbi:SWIRM-domain-containing protein [Neocallimastix sp. 'constans']
MEYKVINKFKDDNIVIHCLEYPDSYNKIIKATDEYENCNFNENNDSIWNVSINWLRNCLRFKDWISEQDFVVDKQEIEEEKERRLNKYPETVEEARDYLINKSKKIIIPEYAKWFSFLKVHEREKKALPEFFSNKNKSKTEEIYKEYRNFIINTYRMNPSEYLTVTSCRRFLAGDICSIMRIHSFLEQWGLINYQINPETRPSKIGPSFTGHFRITANTPKGLVPFFPNIPASIATLNDNEQGQNNNNKNNNNNNNKNKQIFCSTCKTDCTQKRYHCLTQRNINLCPNCYSEGIFPVDLTSSNFIKLENSIIDQEIDDRWTDQELLLLLEGIELYDDEWMKVAEYVGTKTHRQCISKFLELPIEDPFLEKKLESESSIPESKISANIGPMKYSRIPFNQADNPVLSVVTFLASIADSKATKAAVKAAIEELEKPNSLKKYIQSYKQSILNKNSNVVKKEEEEEKNKQSDSDKSNDSSNISNKIFYQ